jgi:hypothetical protein
MREKSKMAASTRPAARLMRFLPILGWLPSYRLEWLLPDILAGVAVLAVMAPARTAGRCGRGHEPH